MVKEYSDMMLPPFAKYLDKYTKKWEISDMGGSLMIPKYNHYFNSILFRSRKLSFSTDKTWEFIASVPVVDKKDTSDLINKSFQLLKGAECEIKGEGLFKKNFKFISNPMLEYLKEEIPELKIDTSLIESFEQDTDLRRLLSIIKPDKLSIKLFSQPIMTKDLEEYREEFKAIFYNPIDGIIWNIIIERYLDDIFTKSSYTKVLDAIIEVFDVFSIALTNISKTKMWTNP
jgi:hypothetical protein